MSKRPELEGLLLELMLSRQASAEAARLPDADLQVFRENGRLFRLLGLIPTDCSSQEELTRTWNDLVNVLLSLRTSLAVDVSR